MIARLVLGFLLLLGGCAGWLDDPGPIPSDPPVAVWPPGTGSIWVSVLDGQGQLVTQLDGFLLPHGQLLTDDVPGHISASALTPGHYQLEVGADGYLDGTLLLVVVADRIALGELKLTEGAKPTPSYPLLAVTEVLDYASGEVTVDAAVRMEAGSEVLVAGFLVTREGGGGDPAWLCEAELPSLPPQCGGPRFMLVGLDPAAVPGVQVSHDVYYTWLAVRGTIMAPCRATTTATASASSSQTANRLPCS